MGSCLEGFFGRSRWAGLSGVDLSRPSGLLRIFNNPAICATAHLRPSAERGPIVGTLSAITIGAFVGAPFWHWKCRKERLRRVWAVGIALAQRRDSEDLDFQFAECCEQAFDIFHAGGGKIGDADLVILAGAVTGADGKPFLVHRFCNGNALVGGVEHNGGF